MKNNHIQGINAKGKILLLGFCLFNTLLFSQVNSACFNSHNDNAFLSANAAQGFDVADFNNDGKLDLAFVSFLTSGNLLTVKMGNGDGTFQANATYNVGVRPNSIRAKDLDADGDIDIVVSNHTFGANNARISIVFNNGSGVFGAATSYSGSIPGPSPSAPNMFEVDVNDVTGDGLVDIVVAVNNGFEVFTNLGGAPAIFQSPTFTNATNSSSRGLIVANFDGIAGNDVVTANYGSPNFSLRTNTGTGTFNAAVNFTCSSNPIDIATADFDADGDLDIVTANEAFDQISIFLNNGSGNFGTHTVMSAGDAPSAIKCADINNDGNVDIIVTNNNSNTLSICHGNGNGTFQTKYEIIAIATPKNLVVGDFDSDGRTDVITSTQTQSISQFFKGSTAGLTDLGINYSTNAIVKHITSSDLNNDGKNDVLVANGTANSFDVYFSLGNAVYNTVPTTYTIPGSNNPTIIQSNFLNNSDTDKDVAVYYAGSTKVTVFNGSPTGTLTSFASFTPGATVNNFAFEQLVGSSTNKDFVLARTDGQIEIRENDGTASFPVFQTLSTGATAVSFVTVKDLNNDGFNDIITANGTSNTISVFLYNTGSNNFNSAINLSTPANSSPAFLDVKDLNNDGFADIVSANSGLAPGFSRFLNNTLGGFGTIQTSSNTGSAVKAVHLLDFNNDGNLDIGLTSQNGANTTGFIEVFMGNGSGTFGTAPTPFKKFSTEVGTSVSNANDFNEDNRPDFVILNEVSKSFNFVLNATPWINAAGPTTFCSGNSVIINSKIQENYLWSPTSETTQNITASTSGSYYLTSSVGKTGWCTSNSMNPLTITVTPGPTAPTITAGGSTNVCAGGSLVLTSSSATNNLWSTGDTTQSITVSTSGNYSCSIVSGGCQSSPSNTITVNVADAPIITPAGPVTACSVSITLNSSIGGSFILWSNGITTQTNTVTTTGNYFVTYSVPGCPSVNSNTVNVTIGNLATPTITPSGTVNFCSGGSVTLTSSSPNFNVWSNGSTSQSITVSTAGTYTLHLDDGTCSSGNTSVIVNEITNPSATITLSGATTFCTGGSVILTANSGAGLSYQWQLNGSNISGETSLTYSANSTGNYSVVVTNSNGCSTTSSNLSVTVNPIPSITLGTLTNPTTCGGTDGAILISGTGTGDLAWTGTASGSATSITLPFTISSLAAGSYSISY
ncbi:MAG: FG-GAP-like repeat-containing protein, partial [Fluviicola sp.]